MLCKYVYACKWIIIRNVAISSISMILKYIYYHNTYIILHIHLTTDPYHCFFVIFIKDFSDISENVSSPEILKVYKSNVYQ